MGSAGARRWLNAGSSEKRRLGTLARCEEGTQGTCVQSELPAMPLPRNPAATLQSQAARCRQRTRQRSACPYAHTHTHTHTHTYTHTHTCTAMTRPWTSTPSILRTACAGGGGGGAFAAALRRALVGGACMAGAQAAALLSGRRWFFESPPPSVSSGNRLPRGCLLPSESLRHARRL